MLGGNEVLKPHLAEISDRSLMNFIWAGISHSVSHQLCIAQNQDATPQLHHYKENSQIPIVYSTY